MDLHRVPTAAALLERAGAFLREHELLDSLLLTLAVGLGNDAVADPARAPYLAIVADGARVTAVALRTPPHNLVLSHVAPDDRDAALALVADDVRGMALPGATGPLEVVEAFGARWSAMTGARPRRLMALREHALARVRPAERAAGSPRAAREDDVDRVLDWSIAFVEETGLPAADRALVQRERIASRVAAGRFWFWCDVGGVPVAMAAAGGTDRVPRIGSVYTPPERRGRGYASALVAAISARLLDAGAWRVALSTDVANPTSNRIYAAIGYEPVGDTAMIAFDG